MAGVGVTYDVDGLAGIEGALRSLGSADARVEVLEVVGAIAESAARERIADTKTAPDGEPWAPWAARTARRRQDRHSLLSFEGDLADSLGWEVAADGSQVEIGSPLVYAAVHQLGSEEDDPHPIPARPYLGFSPDDQAAAEAAALARLTRLLEGR